MHLIHLDFQQAKAKHLLFKSRLRAILYGELREDEDQVIAQYECPVNKWIFDHTLSSFSYNNIPELHDLENLHAEIHAIARKLLRSYKQGFVQDARKGLAGMELVADSILRVLTVVEEKVLPGEKQVVITEPVFQTLTQSLTELVTKNEILDKSIRSQYEELLLNQQMLENFFKQAPGFYCVLKGPAHTCEVTNAAYLQLIGNRDPVGMPIREALPELAGQGFYELLDTVYATQKPFKGNQLKIVLARGKGNAREEAYLDFIFQPVINKTGGSDGVIVFGYEATEQVLVRQQLEDAEARLRMAAEGTGLATFDLDLETQDIIYSPRLNELLGYSPEHVLAYATMHEHIHRDDVESIVKPAFEKGLQNGTYKYEARVVMPNSTIRWILTQGKVSFNKAQEPVRMVGTMMDITAKKIVEEALGVSEKGYRTLSEALEIKVTERTRSLAASVKDLESTNRELASFNYIASHDLQEPLRKIQTFVSLISNTDKDQLSSKSKDYFKRITGAAERMQALIESLLSYSKNTSGETLLVPVDMNQLLQEVLADLHEVIEEKQVMIKVKELPVMNVIKSQIQQVFVNLIENAIKYSKTKPLLLITIDAERILGRETNLPDALQDQAYWKISVTDNGIGFDEQHKFKVFELFQRLHTRTEYSGTGIGLAICKKIMQNHNGFINADSTLDVGSSFYFYVPN